MPAAFKEVLANAGVDEDRKPYPGMIIPAAPGTNLVRLDGGTGYKVHWPASLSYAELTPKDALSEVKTAAAKLGSAVPILPADSRVFRVWARAAPRNQTVTATKRHAKTPEANLEVSVVHARPISLAIRPVQIPDPADPKKVTSHSHLPTDPKTLNAAVAFMNSIWTPQANVVFNLVSTAPYLPSGADIAKAFGLKATSGSLADSVDFPKFGDLFDQNKDKADYAMFLVYKATDTGSPTDAVTMRDLPVSLISDSRKSLPDIFAHEAGHLLGFRGHSGKGPKELMNEGGSIVDKISYGDVISIFNKK